MAQRQRSHRSHSRKPSGSPAAPARWPRGRGSAAARCRSAGRRATAADRGAAAAGAKRSTQLPVGASATGPASGNRRRLGHRVGLMQDAKIRLYVDQPLGPGQAVPLSQDQAHYLFGVMRLAVGAAVAAVQRARRRMAGDGDRGGQARRHRWSATTRPRPLHLPPDLWLLFAPIKKARTDFIVEKAVELGVARILPVQTAPHQFRTHPAGPPAGPCGRGGRTMRRDLCARGGRPGTAGPGAAQLARGPPPLWCDEHRAGQTAHPAPATRGRPGRS